MKKYFIHLILSLCLLMTCCTRRPKTLPPSTNRNDRVSQYHRERKPQRKEQSPLATKVQKLADEVDRAYKRNRVSTDDISRWAQLYSEYYLEYTLSTHHLTDEECASVEFNFGKIAGRIYKNTITPVLKELNDISNGLEEYQQRSKKWEGAIENGFQSGADSD